MAASARSESPGLFDRFASWVSDRVARAPFFVACLALVLLWLPSYPLFQDSDSWHLALNSPTTALSFLLIALLGNATSRANKAAALKQNAIAVGLADLTEALGHELGSERLLRHARDLRASVGLEDRVHS